MGPPPCCLYDPAFRRARSSGKQRAQKDLWSRAAGITSVMLAEGPVKSHPQAAVQPPGKKSPGPLQWDRRCHLPLGLCAKLLALRATASTSTAAMASDSGSSMASGTRTCVEDRVEEEEAAAARAAEGPTEAGPKDRWRMTSSNVMARAAMAAQVAANSSGTSRM